MHFLEQLLCRSFVCHQTDIGWSPAYRGKPPGRWISRLEWFPSGGSQRFPGWVEISCLMGWITNSGMGPWSLKRGLYIPTAFVHLMTGHSSEWWLNSAIKRWAAPELRLPGHKTKKTPMQKIPKALLESFRVCLEPTFDLGKAETWSERWEALNRERIMAQSQTHRQFFSGMEGDFETCSSGLAQAGKQPNKQHHNKMVPPGLAPLGFFGSREETRDFWCDFWALNQT